jgi:hypothetical protein
VLVSSQASSSYTVTLVGVNGTVAASAQASTPVMTSCGNVAAAPFPLPVSTSDTRVYFMDATGAVHWLTPNGGKDQAPIATVPAATASQRSTFAVSPDDTEMAVVVADHTTTGATTSLYIYDLNKGGSNRLIFSETGIWSLWAVGWRGTGSLVLAVVPSCTQGGPFAGVPLELHVVDPATATRRFTIGSSSCPPVSWSAGGVICEQPPKANVLSWTAAPLGTYPIQGPVGAYVSPDGKNVAIVDSTAGTSFTGGGSAMSGVFTCEWIDDTHVLAGGDAQQQPRIGDVTTGAIAPVAAQGDCGGRIPGGL